MHFLREDIRTIDDSAAATDLAQSPADIVFLSYSDSDLGILSLAAQARGGTGPTLRLANLAQLQHPFSIDLYIEKTIAKARFVLVRLLGGCDYWRYGVDELFRAAKQHNIILAIIPGDDRPDLRLEMASTLEPDELARLWAYFQYGGLANMRALLDTIQSRTGLTRSAAEPQPVPMAAEFQPCCIASQNALGHALIVFYRSFMTAGNTLAIEALAKALAARNLNVTTIFVTSLKDDASIEFINGLMRYNNYDIILNTTAFSARLEDETSVLDKADAPVLQAIISNSFLPQWEIETRGLKPADLAMNVVLPEMDGRIVTTAIAFKAEAERYEDLEFTSVIHQPHYANIAHVAGLAANWVTLRKTPPADRKLALVLSDYPAKAGRSGYAVGLDTAKSVASIAALLDQNGFTIGQLPHSNQLMRQLEESEPEPAISVVEYNLALALLPPGFRDALLNQWGAPEEDNKVQNGIFCFPFLRAKNLIIALQPDRGTKQDRKAQYHDAALMPCHSYVAFYIWLREQEKIHALVHCGTHGTLEWLPGKSAALSSSCAPCCVLGALPVIYPFIVNNPGEAAQAKRRIAAVTIGHMTPPLITAENHGAALEIEALIDEYTNATGLDPKRANLLANTILLRAKETGLLQESGAAQQADPLDALSRLDAWLCGLKEMRINDGLHVFGEPPIGAQTSLDASLLSLCATSEKKGLLKALEGCFVLPGPGGTPTRGRFDVLPTGRNLFGIDPRALPTRTAWETGNNIAREVSIRYAQDHGEWPKTIVMDLWASATMRTGGEDLAQAMALMGVKPQWDNTSSRVSGFSILPEAKLEHPRIDVTLRVSGLFRDLFLAQINLFDQAVQAVSELDEEACINPLAEERRQTGLSPSRIFGAAPQAYGLGILAELNANPQLTRDALGQHYIAAGAYAYGLNQPEGVESTAFAERIVKADAFIHVQDQAGQDLLQSDAMAEHEGGFAAAAESLQSKAESYHIDTTETSQIKVRTLGEEIARVVRGRVTNPRWIRGQMRHGHRGAAEITETIENFFGIAVLTDAVSHLQFDLVFDAICGDDDVRKFLLRENPKAAKAIAQRFDAALARGLWKSQRNSIWACLAEMQRDGS